MSDPRPTPTYENYPPPGTWAEETPLTTSHVVPVPLPWTAVPPAPRPSRRGALGLASGLVIGLFVVGGVIGQVAGSAGIEDVPPFYLPEEGPDGVPAEVPTGTIDVGELSLEVLPDWEVVETGETTVLASGPNRFLVRLYDRDEPTTGKREVQREADRHAGELRKQTGLQVRDESFPGYSAGLLVSRGELGGRPAGLDVRASVRWDGRVLAVVAIVLLDSEELAAQAAFMRKSLFAQFEQ